jgi:nucleoside phosphorylase
MYVVDYLVVIALDEEFRSALDPLRDGLGVQLTIQPEGPLVTARAAIPLVHEGVAHEELLVAVCPGQMGHAAIAAILPDILDRYRPRDIILIGLSGSFDSKDLLLGDVLAPMKVFGYAEAKVVQVQGKNVWTFRTLGDRTTSHARAQIRAIANDPALCAEWKKQCLEAASCAQPDRQITSRFGVSSRELPKIHVHHNDSLASGNVVIASKAFSKELQQKVDPTLCAVDMEAGGLFESMAATDWLGRVLVLRGISDYADSKKSKLEKQFKDGWRLYAMQNAVRLATMLIKRRLQWEPDRQSASAPYDLSLTPHDESYVLCEAIQVLNSEAAGAQNLAFVPLLQRSEGSPRFSLVIEDIRERPDSFPMMMLLREKRSPYLEVRHHVRPEGNIQMTREASNDAFDLDLFVSSPVGGTAFRITLRG